MSTDPKNFIETLSAYKEKVHPIIKSYVSAATTFPDFCKIDKKYHDVLDFHQKIISDYPDRKGKYLRPSLLLLTAESMSADIHNCLKLAAAMQLSEEWILIHDDIEDDSLERRGGPALHRLYGKEQALNAGDALHVIMWKIIFDCREDFSDEVWRRIYQEFYLLLNRTTVGQYIDIRWNQENILNLGDDDIFLILESKTCYYTIAGPMRLGAIAAGATETQLNQIYQFGLNLGRAFQIIDDILDLTSDFSGLKKQQYNDIYEGKRTIMLGHLWRTASTTDKKIIFDILHKTRDQKTAGEVSQIVSLMDKYQSIEYGKKLALGFAAKAKEILSQDLSFIKREPFRSQIEAGVDFIVNRQH